jgi:hypothetical protein
MNQPSDEAMAAAYELVCATREGEGEISVTFGDTACFFNDEGEAEGYIDDLRLAVATAIDDHTAALRAEVEALRARVVEWKAVAEQSPQLGRAVLLYDPIAPYIVTPVSMWQDAWVAGVETKVQVLVWCNRDGTLHRKALRTDQWQCITNPTE